MRLALAGLLLAGCTSLPTGPSMMALPGTSMSFDQFRADDSDCRQYAYAQVGGTTAGAAQTSAGVRSAAVGTAVGALAGAAIDGSHGAAVGAGTGLLVGSAAGAGAAETSAYGAQRRYDQGYLQCMYAKGHRIPVYGRFTDRGADPGRAPSRSIPPPPPR